MMGTPKLVYFVLADDGRVKIGVAVNVKARLKALQTGSPTTLKVVRTLPGGFAAEQWFHQHFAELRIQGEWFRWDDRMTHTFPPADAHDVVLEPVEPVVPVEMDAPETVTKQRALEAFAAMTQLLIVKTAGGRNLSDDDLIEAAPIIEEYGAVVTALREKLNSARAEQDEFRSWQLAKEKRHRLNRARVARRAA
jgi:hypothetical protein